MMKRKSRNRLKICLVLLCITGLVLHSGCCTKYSARVSLYDDPSCRVDCCDDDVESSCLFVLNSCDPPDQISCRNAERLEVCPDAPVITTLSTSHGRIGATFLLTIYGRLLSNVTEVVFGGFDIETSITSKSYDTVVANVFIPPYTYPGHHTLYVTEWASGRISNVASFFVDGDDATFLGPDRYRCKGDSPFRSTIISGDTILEDFEDNALNTPGVSANRGQVINHASFCGGGPPCVDSVDCDDGVEDGSGHLGHSFFVTATGTTSITFTFDRVALGGLPRHAGLVWTDGVNPVFFKAYGPVGDVLGTRGPFTLADDNFNGGTDEDRFFGVINPDGISAIEIIQDRPGIEVDHLQYERPPLGPFAPMSLHSLASDESTRIHDRLNRVKTKNPEPMGLSSAGDIQRGSIVLTPVADGTVQQVAVKSGEPGSPNIVRTTGPAAIASAAQIQGTPIDLVDRTNTFNFQRYGLAIGGALDFRGSSRLEGFVKSIPVPPSGIKLFDQARFGAVGAVEFDLHSVKTALEQLNISASAVHATLRLTPVRSLNIFDLLTSTSSTQLPTTTEVALLEMTQNQKDLVIDYKDFPGFTSPRLPTLQELAAAINTAPPEKRATVRTDLLGMLSPVSFDVTAALQRDLQTATATTGFQLASELNGAGLIFADSSMLIPGLSESVAPTLIIEIAGYSPSGAARFVASTVRVVFDSLGQGSTDMVLVTINNVGASEGTIALDLNSGAEAFGLITPDDRILNAQGNAATIAAGERITVGVTFKPGDRSSFQGELQVTDTTGGKHDIVNRIALSGSTLPPSFSQGIPAITAPLKPQRLPDHAARVGDLNGDGLLDAVDISQLSAIVAGRVTAPSQGTASYAVADINGDGAISAADLSILGDALVRNLNALPRLVASAGEISMNSRYARHPASLPLSTNHTPRSRRTGGAIPRFGR